MVKFLCTRPSSTWDRPWEIGGRCLDRAQAWEGEGRLVGRGGANPAVHSPQDASNTYPS